MFEDLYLILARKPVIGIGHVDKIDTTFYYAAYDKAHLGVPVIG
jgi:hypothetical protein